VYLSKWNLHLRAILFDFWSSLKNHIYVIAEKEISATTTILTKLLVPISTGRKDKESIPLQM
jgi:hypothetical protein